MKSATVLLIFVLLPGPIQAQANVEKEVLAADAALLAAIEKGDAAAYDKLTSDDFVWVTPAGSVVTKSERLELIKKGPVAGFKGTKQQVRRYGDTAIVMGEVGEGKPMRYSRVWVRQNGQWKAVLNHATLVMGK